MLINITIVLPAQHGQKQDLVDLLACTNPVYPDLKATLPVSQKLWILFLLQLLYKVDVL